MTAVTVQEKPVNEETCGWFIALTRLKGQIKIWPGHLWSTLNLLHLNEIPIGLLYKQEGYQDLFQQTN